MSWAYASMLGPSTPALHGSAATPPHVVSLGQSGSRRAVQLPATAFPADQQLPSSLAEGTGGYNHPHGAFFWARRLRLRTVVGSSNSASRRAGKSGFLGAGDCRQIRRPSSLVPPGRDLRATKDENTGVSATGGVLGRLLSVAMGDRTRRVGRSFPVGVTCRRHFAAGQNSAGYVALNSPAWHMVVPVLTVITSRRHSCLTASARPFFSLPTAGQQR